MCADDCGFLAAMLSRGARENAADFSDQFALYPKAASLIEEVAHLCTHIAIARRCAEYDLDFGKKF